MKTKRTEVGGGWSAPVRVTFLCGSLFLILLILPLDWHFWRPLFSLAPWQAFFHLATYQPQFVTASLWGFSSFLNVWICLVAALLSGATVYILHDDNIDYSKCYLWIRAIVRYRLALALLAYGILKVFELQFPKPTLSELNTQYGDLMQWKIYYLTVSVGKFGYQPIMGVLEIVCALLMLWGRTATIGACLAAAMLTNIVPANFAYQFGDHVFSSLLMLFATTIAAHDGWRLLRVLVLQFPTRADHETPLSTLRPKLVQRARLAIVAFGLLFSGLLYAGTLHSRWPYPDNLGLPGMAGVYNVRAFWRDGQVMPYTLTGPDRWQDVVFEEWNTFSVRVNQPLTIQVAKPAVDDADAQKRYEVAGNGGRHFYTYTFDSKTQTLRATGANDGGSATTFHYAKQPDGGFAMDGRDANGANLHIVLDKMDKKYLLDIGRRKPVNLY